MRCKCMFENYVLQHIFRNGYEIYNLLIHKLLGYIIKVMYPNS